MWRYSWIFLLAVNLCVEPGFTFEIIPCFDYGNFNELLDINDTSIRINLDGINPIQEDNSTQYIVEYSHIKHLGCSDDQATLNGNITRIESNGTEIMLDNLIPFSLYGITLWEVSENKTCIENGTFKTKDSDILGDDEKPVISDILNRTEVVVTITWPCKYVLGPIFHEIEIACASLSCVRETYDYNEVENASTIIVKFPATKQTAYLVKLKYWRGAFSRSPEYNVFVNAKEPNKVGDLKIYSANETDVSLRWLPPGSDTGELEHYEIEYYLRGTDVKKVIVDKSSYCQIWKNYICHTIHDENFLDNAFSFEVQAKNLLVKKSGLSALVHVITGRGKVPSPPLNITYEVSGDRMIIDWQHPDEPFGTISRYYIEINNALLLTYNITEQRLNYSYEINMNDYNLTSDKVLIEIVAVNEFGNSTKSSSWNIKPHFLETPTINNETASTLDIEFSSVLDVTGDASKMYVVITAPFLQFLHEDLHPREEELFQTIDANRNYSWTIGEFDLRNMSDRLTVGDESEGVSQLDSTWKFSNRKLESDQEYNITIVLNDTLFTTSKLQVYGLTGQTLVRTGPTGFPVANGNTYYLWSLLLIPASLCIVYAAFLSGVQRRRRSLIGKILFCGFWENYNNPQIYASFSLPTIEDNADDIKLDPRNFTRIIKIQDLDSYIKSSTENGELEKQYEKMGYNIRSSTNRQKKENQEVSISLSIDELKNILAETIQQETKCLAQEIRRLKEELLQVKVQLKQDNEVNVNENATSNTEYTEKRNVNKIDEFN